MALIGNLGDIFHDPLSNGEFTWTFPNLFSTSVRDSFTHIFPSIVSPWFCFEGEKFRIALLPSGYMFGLFVWQSNLNSKEKRFQIDIFFKTSEFPSWEDFDWLNERSSCSSYHSRLRTKPNEDIGEWQFNTMNIFRDVDSISPGGKVTVSWKMSILPEQEGSDNISNRKKCVSSSAASVFAKEELSNADNKKNVVPGAKGVERLLQNFGNLFQDGKNSDVILKVGGREFATHRCILGVRSPVFASMFQHDMAEKSSDAVDIPDCSPEAFEVFLRYLYTGRTSGGISDEIVFNLYYAADKYQVHDLKEDCVEFMKNTLSVDTFCDIVSLALCHCESELLKAATDFFRDNVKKIIKTVQWQSYIQENPLQANELYIKALNA